MENPYGLLAYCTILCFLSEYMSAFLKPVISLFTQFGKSSFQDLRSELCQTKNEMEKLSVTDDFAKYVKLQRKLNKMQDELKANINEQLKYSVKVRYGITYAVHGIINILYFIVCWCNWRTTVITLPENWLYPFSYVLSWPSSVSGGISVPNWLLITNVTFKLISKSIKKFS
ncbi:guided entry of tail-anchored proteins factor 1 [Lycorma delicatula]|uniref:guided entry of tail-anchored proteins factor 1 n=1 Tax=Lycorma delicatula TaxID=130591 RepID=UPI003F50FB82